MPKTTLKGARPRRDTGCTFITGEMVGDPRFTPVWGFLEQRNPPGSGPARRAAAIRASVYSAAKQRGAPIKTFDRNSQISCCTRSVFQTTAGGSQVERNVGASSNGSVGLHHILPLTLRGNDEALKSMAGSFRISVYNRFIPIYQRCFPTGIF